jgi:transcriptional regulator with XRE-family HTH domain
VRIVKGRTLFGGVAERIRALRKEAQLSQEELAERASLNPFYVVRMEAGRQNLSLQTIGRVALALDVAPAKLFEGVVAEPGLLEAKPRSNARTKPSQRD